MLAVSLIDVKGEKQMTQNFSKTFSVLENESKLFSARFCHRKNILDSPATYLHKGTLKVLAEVSLFEKESRISVSTLAKDYASLLQSGSLSDVTLVVGGKEFPVHKLLLSARSPVFKRMFTGEFKESTESRVVLEEMDEQVFTVLLNYIYTDKIENLAKYAAELLIAAEKYQIETLRDFCGHYLSTILAADNFVSLLQLAHLHNAAQLQSKCLAFFRQHYQLVKLTQQWKKLITIKCTFNQEILGLLRQMVLESDKPVKKVKWF